jgi:hypothetical protein
MKFASVEEQTGIGNKGGENCGSASADSAPREEIRWKTARTSKVGQ